MPTIEDMFTAFRTEYKALAVDPAIDQIFEDDYDCAVALCDRAGIAAVVTAWHDALIAVAEGEDISLVRRIDIAGSYLVEEGDDLADWLREHRPEGGEG